MSPFDPAGLKEKIDELTKLTVKENFWSDAEKAEEILKSKKALTDKLLEYENLVEKISDIEILLQLAEEENDEESAREALELSSDFIKDLDKIKIKTLLTGEYDANNAILSIHAGSGGTDAQDWAEILLRMYTRYGEQNGYKVKLIYLQEDTEGGIKSATMTVEGENAYGYLKNEKGVHRLVRISPYDSSGRRHTSFASVDVMPQIDDDISVEIDPEDLRIDTFRSGGAGGQHVNKTDSAVRITHIPTNIVVSCQNERSQHQNKDMAMKILKSKLIELAEEQHKENLKELKGDFSQITWGSQIRSYVFHPYTMVKDHRTGAEVGNVDKVLDGDLQYFIDEELKQL